MNRITAGTFLEKLLAPQILWSVFLFSTSILIIITIILLYHWRTYALRTPTMHKARIIYVAGSGLFFILQLTALLSL